MTGHLASIALVLLSVVPVSIWRFTGFAASPALGAFCEVSLALYGRAANHDMTSDGGTWPRELLVCAVFKIE